MNAARALIEEVRAAGVLMVADGDRLKLSGSSPLPAPIMERLKASKAVVLMELRAGLPWWRDPEAIRVRFDEIAGYMQFDQNMPNDDAERMARDVLARELHDYGLSTEAVRKAMKIMMETTP